MFYFKFFSTYITDIFIFMQGYPGPRGGPGGPGPLGPPGYPVRLKYVQFLFPGDSDPSAASLLIVRFPFVCGCFEQIFIVMDWNLWFFNSVLHRFTLNEREMLENRQVGNTRESFVCQV